MYTNPFRKFANNWEQEQADSIARSHKEFGHKGLRHSGPLHKWLEHNHMGQEHMGLGYIQPGADSNQLYDYRFGAECDRKVLLRLERLLQLRCSQKRPLSSVY